MKKSILTAMTLLMAAGSVSAQSTVQEKWNRLAGNRVDFLNAAGERIASRYPQQYETSTVWFSAYGDMETGFRVTDGSGFPFSSMKVIPFGVYSYPVTTSSGTTGVDYNYTVVTDTNGDGVINFDDVDFSSITTRKAPGRAEGKGEVKNGEVLLLTIDIPEGTYPLIEFNERYSMFDPYNEEPIFMDLTLPIFNLLAINFESYSSGWLFNTQNREERLEWYRSTGYFYADPTVKNRWHVLWGMPNEPLEIRFSAIYAGGELLNTAVSSASRFLYRQLPTLDSSSIMFCGEPWFMMHCGEALSQDDISTLLMNSNHTFILPDFFSNATYKLPYLAWEYYIAMIDASNFYINNLDKYNMATETERQRAEASLRVLRANSYLRLMQMFGPRWEDSSNGQTPVAPILTEWGNLDLAPATMAEMRDFCKNDLEYAINQLDGVEIDDPLTPDADVARGLLVRLSLLTHDWQTAAEQSQSLLAKYPLTTNDEMKAGFFSPAGSWIWSAPEVSANGEDSLYYWSFQNSAAVNGTYPIFWNVGCKVGCIDRTLFMQIPDGDIRREMFVMPENMHAIGSRVTSYYDGKHIDASNMKLTTMRTAALMIIDNHKPVGVNQKIGDCYEAKNYDFYFGSQFKFWGGMTNLYNSGDNVCLMRVDEMLISRAEALYELGDEAGARECISRLNKLRNTGYSCTASGTALRDEIRLTRRIELWGEGHSWFDFKRWNIPVVRSAWVEGDTESGNWPTAVAGTFATSDYNGWRFLVPKRAADANPNLDINAYGYTNPQGYVDENPTGKPAAGKSTSAAPALQKELLPFSKATAY